LIDRRGFAHLRVGPEAVSATPLDQRLLRSLSRNGSLSDDRAAPTPESARRRQISGRNVAKLL
jgi:hypothetical protein